MAIKRREKKSKKVLEVKVIRKAIFPMAGSGTRFLPITYTMPKEGIAAFNTPVILPIVDSVIDAGITHIICVISSDKTVLQKIFKNNQSFAKELKGKGKLKELNELESIWSMNQYLKWEINDNKDGDGGAIKTARHHLESGEPMLVVFGDGVFIPTYDKLKGDIKNPLNSIEQLIRAYDKYQTSIVSLSIVTEDEADQFGIARMDPDWKILEFVEKPKDLQVLETLRAPDGKLYAANGQYVLEYEITHNYIDRVSPVKGEYRSADALALAIREGVVIYGLPLENLTWYDTGNPFGLLKLSVHFALQDPEVKTKFADYIGKLIGSAITEAF